MNIGAASEPTLNDDLDLYVLLFDKEELKFNSTTGEMQNFRGMRLNTEYRGKREFPRNEIQIPYLDALLELINASSTTEKLKDLYETTVYTDENGNLSAAVTVSECALTSSITVPVEGSTFARKYVELNPGSMSVPDLVVPINFKKLLLTFSTDGSRVSGRLYQWDRSYASEQGAM